ncbi:hypothetical protein QQ045_006272 [Rhodiola kirilowii]
MKDDMLKVFDGGPCQFEKSAILMYGCEADSAPNKVWIDPTKPLVTGFYLGRLDKEPVWMLARYERLPQFYMTAGYTYTKMEFVQWNSNLKRAIIRRG